METPTPFQRHAVLEHTKELGWRVVGYRYTFADAMVAMDALSRKDENVGKWYIVRAVDEKAVA
jgi:hypothetical protein